MKEKGTHIMLKAVALFLASIFILLVANRIFFMHSHTLSDGTVIQHAHPNHDNNGKKHSHSDAQYIFFHHLKLLSLIVILPFIAFYLIHLAVFLFRDFLIEKQSRFQYFTGRAPPENVFI